jgi:hypothetical protein
MAAIVSLEHGTYLRLVLQLGNPPILSHTNSMCHHMFSSSLRVLVCPSH